MNGNYKLEERIIKYIVMRNTKCKNDNDQLKIIFYYKNKKTANILIKNNPKSQVDTIP